MSIQYTKPRGSHNLEENKWKYVQDTETSVLGHNFAHIVALKADGRFNEIDKRVKHKDKKYPAFKKLFWEEPLHNPPLLNTHICNEYDAFYKEEGKYWSRVNAGAKFSNDPQRAKQYHGDHGPFKPVEFPHVMEKPVKQYGRTRQIRPFDVAHQYNKPVERPVSKELLERSHISTYYPPDIWTDGLKPVCGSQVESPMFRSKTPTGRMVHTHAASTDSIMHSCSTFSSTNRVRTPKHLYPHLRQPDDKHHNNNHHHSEPYLMNDSQSQTALLVPSSSGNTGSFSRPQSPSIIEQHRADPALFTQHAVIHSPKIGHNNQGNTGASGGGINSNSGSFVLEGQSVVEYAPESSVSRPHTDPGTSRLKTLSDVNSSSGGKYKSRPKTGREIARAQSHKPGFSFLGSTSDASIFDIIQYDNPVSYRRVIDALDGKTDHIMPVKKSVKSALSFTPELATSPKNKGKKGHHAVKHDYGAVVSEYTPLPDGVKYRPVWAQTQHFAEADTSLVLNSAVNSVNLSATNSINLTENVDRIPPATPDPHNYVLDDHGLHSQNSSVSGAMYSFNDSLSATALDMQDGSLYAKNIIDKWKPPMNYSRKPVTAPQLSSKKQQYVSTGERPKSRNVEDLIPVNRVRSGSSAGNLLMKKGNSFDGNGIKDMNLFVAPELIGAVNIPSVTGEDDSLFSS